MVSLIRIGFNRLANTNATKFLTNSNNVKNIGLRCISGKTVRGHEKTQKPKPWDYERKWYTIVQYMYDKTTARIDENSKIIVVEGPLAAGKTKLAKALADEFEMLYLPEANLDMIWINQFGYDLRKLDEQLPESCRSFDVNNFMLNPKNRLTASFQFKQYSVKFSQYIDALAHLFSTGQGIVLDRCVYSDFVFVEAMYSQGYISKGAYKAYYDLRRNTITELKRPHLVLYLDVPVPKVIDNIKKRNIAYEVNSPVVNPNYLGALEKNYKQKYLKQISQHAELLVYDWSEGGDVEVVIEDIERLKFEKSDPHDQKFEDWVFFLEEEWANARFRYSDNKDHLLTYLNLPCFEVPELTTDADDVLEYKNILAEAPGEQYEKGYDSKMGDKGILFKSGRSRDTLPRRERVIQS